jgi:hypothetical protein
VKISELVYKKIHWKKLFSAQTTYYLISFFSFTFLDRLKFHCMSPREKRQYLAQRGLLLSTFQHQQQNSSKVSSEGKLPDSPKNDSNRIAAAKNIGPLFQTVSAKEKIKAKCSEETHVEASQSTQQQHQVTIQTEVSKISNLQRTSLFSPIHIPQDQQDQTGQLLVSSGSAQQHRYPRQKVQLVQQCDPITKRESFLC